MTSYLADGKFLNVKHHLQSSQGECSKNPEWVISKDEIPDTKKRNPSFPRW